MWVIPEVESHRVDFKIITTIAWNSFWARYRLMRTHIQPKCVTSLQLSITTGVFIGYFWKVNSPMWELPQHLYLLVFLHSVALSLSGRPPWLPSWGIIWMEVSWKQWTLWFPTYFLTCGLMNEWWLKDGKILYFWSWRCWSCGRVGNVIRFEASVNRKLVYFQKNYQGILFF